MYLKCAPVDGEYSHINSNDEVIIGNLIVCSNDDVLASCVLKASQQGTLRGHNTETF
jgi:hypothetical protein